MVRGIQLIGDPGVGHAHGVQHRVGPEGVRGVPDVVQGPVRRVPPVVVVVVGQLGLAALHRQVAAGQVGLVVLVTIRQQLVQTLTSVSVT